MQLTVTFKKERAGQSNFKVNSLIRSLERMPKVILKTFPLIILNSACLTELIKKIHTPS